MSRWREWSFTIVRLFGRNAVTVLGASLATVSAAMILTFVVLGLLGMAGSPYVGIIAFLILPGVFVLGLVLIPIGAYLGRKRERTELLADGTPAQPFPVLDFNNQRMRRMALLVIALTIANVVILALASYEGVQHMDSVEFCGLTCHKVMAPEHTAYQNSRHARVSCVECHIGPGAPWFVRSKLSGLGQVLAVTFNTYERPIPTPVKNLRPARETCEHCHWPEEFSGDRIKVIDRFASDEANSATKTVLSLHIGGGGRKHGIHSWHIDKSKETVYLASDAERQVIPWVQVKKADGTVEEFTAGGKPLDPTQIASAEKRVMDCIDCHNRTAHDFDMPSSALDEALARGRIDRKLPFIKKTALDALQAASGPKEAAKEQIAKAILSFYEAKSDGQADQAAITAAIAEVQKIYERNIFPEMSLTWGSYPRNLGHADEKGCFRCHDDEHLDKDGKAISKSCSLCHTVLAEDEEEPEILKQLKIR